MEHQQIRTLFGQHLTQLVARPGDLPVTPRPYQVETLDSTARWLLSPEGTRRGYVVHATGLGKTVLFASMVAAASGMRSLVVVPTKLLLAQTARVIAKFTGGVLGHLSSLAHIHDDAGETIAIRGLDHSSIVLTTDASFNKLASTIKRDFDPHIIIRDECHWGYIDSALAALNEFPEAVIVGFSATPDFLTNAARDGYTPVTLENGQELYGPRDRFAETHFQTCLDRRTVRWGIESGWLCPLAWGRIEFDISLKEVKVTETPDGADYDQGELQKMMGKHWSVMCETVRRLYEKHEYALADRQAYAVCPSVEAAEELAQAVSSLGIPAACVTGATKDMERDILLQAYRDNEIRFLTSVMVLREGWDAPNAEVCMMLRPTKSRVLYEQAMGRVLRPRDDGENKVALVLDAHFQSQTFHPLSAPALYAPVGQEIQIGDFLIGGRGGGGVRGSESNSPYLPKDAQPRLVVVELFEPPLRGNRSGYLSTSGSTWGVVRAFVRELNISEPTFRALMAKADVPSVTALGANGQPAVFYNRDAVITACADLIAKKPQASRDGILLFEGYERATIETLSKMLRISPPALRRRLEKAKKQSIEGRTWQNAVGAFFRVSDAREVCADLLAGHPQVTTKDGTILLDGVRYGDPTNLSRIVGINNNTVRYRLSKASIRQRVCRDSIGRLTTFYAVDDAVQLFAEYIKQARADRDGILRIDGVELTTIKKFSKDVGISSKSVAARVTAKALVGVQAKTFNGLSTQFFRIADLAAACSDLAAEHPLADRDGFIRNDDGVWGSETKLAQALNISWNALRPRLQKSTCRSIVGKGTSGKVLTFYHLEDAKKACGDFFTD